MYFICSLSLSLSLSLSGGSKGEVWVLQSACHVQLRPCIWIFGTHVKAGHDVMHTYNPSPGEAETEETLKLTGQTVLPSWQGPGSVRDPVSKHKVE